MNGRTILMPNQRIFKSERANRIHWLKPILQHWQDPRITYFKFIESNNTEREYFWFKSKSYIVILEEVSANYYLITGFCVDSNNENFYESKYIHREIS